MRIWQLRLCISLLAMVLCLSGGPAWAAGKMIDLGTLGGNNSKAYDINESGQIAGSAQRSDNHSHAARYADGAWQDLDPLEEKGNSSSAYGINNLGHVVGSFTATDFHTHAFLWTPEGGMIQLPNIPGTNSVAWDINHSGWIVGQYREPTTPYTQKGFLLSPGGVMTTLTPGWGGAYAINDNGQVTGEDESSGFARAFLYDIEKKERTDLGVLAGLASWGSGLNDLGQVVGYSTYNSASEYYRAALYAGGWSSLGVLSGGMSWAYDINNRGQIVGESAAVNNTRIHAFVYEGGVMTDLAPGWYQSHAYGINERGQIVGWYQETSSSSPTRAFLYTPGGFVPDLLLLD